MTLLDVNRFVVLRSSGLALAGTGLFLGAVACGDTDDMPTPTATPTAIPEPTPTATPVPLDEPGRLALTFRMEPDYIPVMDEPPVGYFYGDIFPAGQITSTGPKPGATVLESVEVYVDLTTEGGPTAVLYTTQGLTVEDVGILGFLDSDANDADDFNPDKKDPVTLPWDNSDFVVVPNQTTTIEVFFGMLNP